jgi:hypothetical protein
MNDWEPPQEAWDKFLLFLDADIDVAADKYEVIRRKLITYFERRKCLVAEYLADVAINRVMKRLFEGQLIATLMGYVYGVARIVYLEYLAEQRAGQAFHDEIARKGEPIADAEPNDLRICFDECVETLTTENQEFIKLYYEETGRAKIDNRKIMSEQKNVSQNALVLRAFQIRKKLERCINKCLKKRQA